MNLRKIRIALLLYAAFDLFIGGYCGGFLPLTPIAAAQFTTVSGTVIDPQGLPYANGTIVPLLVSSASPTFTTGGLAYTPPTQPIGLNSAGSFVVQLADNTALSPAGTKWNFQVCSGTGTVGPSFGKGPVCFSLAAPITISGSSQVISTQLNAVAKALTFAAGVGIYQVATLPGGPPIGTPSVVTDGNSATDCTVGGGAFLVLCRWGGASWGTFSGGSASAGGSNLQLQWNNATALGGISGWTTNGTTTVTGGATSVFDLSALAPASGLRIPSVAGAAPTADGFIGFNSTTKALVSGSNGTTIVQAAAATGLNTNTTCANQVFTVISAIAIPTCTSLTTAFLPTLVAGSNGLANSATTDTTSATNITSGTLPNARISGLPLANLATQAADTFDINATGGSASPTAVPAPTTGTNGCAGATDTLFYNTATHTLGCHQITGGLGTVTSSGFSSGTPLAAFSTSTNITPAIAANVIALFSACSGSQYLGADSACHNPTGGGTVTSVGNGVGIVTNTGSPITSSGNFALANPVIAKQNPAGVYIFSPPTGNQLLTATNTLTLSASSGCVVTLTTTVNCTLDNTGNNGSLTTLMNGLPVTIAGLTGGSPPNGVYASLTYNTATTFTVTGSGLTNGTFNNAGATAKTTTGRLTVPTWTASTNYLQYNWVTLGGNLYEALVAQPSTCLQGTELLTCGISNSSGGPSCTGTPGVTQCAVDGNVTWTYQGANSGNNAGHMSIDDENVYVLTSPDIAGVALPILWACTQGGCQNSFDQGSGSTPSVNFATTVNPYVQGWISQPNFTATQKVFVVLSHVLTATGGSAGVNSATPTYPFTQAYANTIQNSWVAGQTYLPGQYIKVAGHWQVIINIGSCIAGTSAPTFSTIGGTVTEATGSGPFCIWADFGTTNAPPLQAAASCSSYGNATMAGLPSGLVLTSVANASGGTTVYTGTITGGAANAFANYLFTISGFTTTADNGTYRATASTATTITLVNAAGAAETHAATASVLLADVNSQAVADLATSIPITWQTPYVTAWKLTSQQAVANFNSAQYAGRISGMNVGMGAGSENFAWCGTSFRAASGGPGVGTNASFQDVWGKLNTVIMDPFLQSLAAGSAFYVGTSVNGFAGNAIQPLSVADTQAQGIAAANIGMGNQGLSANDAVAANYPNNGGSDATNAYNIGLGKVSFTEAESAGLSDPTNINAVEGAGSLAVLLPFYSDEVSTFLMFSQDTLGAFSPNWSWYPTYGQTYQTAIGTFLNGARNLPGMLKDPINNIPAWQITANANAINLGCVKGGTAGNNLNITVCGGNGNATDTNVGITLAPLGTGPLNFSHVTFTDLTSAGFQCLHVSSTGVLTGTGSDCGGANTSLSNLSAVAVNAALSPGSDAAISLDGLSNRYINAWLSGVFGWTNGAGTADTGLSRDSAGVVDVGTGAAGNTGGTIQATAFKGVGTNGGMAGTEGTGANAGTPSAATDILYPDSTNHCWHQNDNNVDIGCSVGGGTAAVTAGDLASYNGTTGFRIQDANLVAANVTTQTSNGAAGQVCTYTGANKVCVPSATPALGASGTIGTIALGNATSGTVTLGTVTGALGSGTDSLPVPVNSPAILVQTVASGTSAMGTSAISSGTCATVVTTSATNTATTDTIIATPNADPTGVTGYAVSATGSLYIQAYPTANNVNFKVCNNTSGSLTPSALTMNWRVVR